MCACISHICNPFCNICRLVFSWFFDICGNLCHSSKVQITHQNIQGLSSVLHSFFYSKRHSEGEYTPNTYLIQEQLFWNRCFLKLCKIHLKTSLLESLFNNVAGLMAWNFIKKRLWHRYFPVNFLQFLKKPYLQNISGWLHLLIPLFKPKCYPLIIGVYSESA